MKLAHNKSNYKDYVDPAKNLAPLRSAIGMLEYWKFGILGSGEMKKWAIGENRLGMELKMFTNEEIPY